MLKRLVLMLLVLAVGHSEQASQCVASAMDPGVDKAFSFTLATLESDASTGPAACYTGCNAHILTASINRRDFNRLTLWDKAAPYLASKEFLTNGESYIIHHLGMPDNQGGNGLGCFEFESPSTFKHHPLSDAACKKATKVVCGAWNLEASISAPDASSVDVPVSVSPSASSQSKLTSPTLSLTSATKSSPTSGVAPSFGNKKEFQVAGDEFRLTFLSGNATSNQEVKDICKASGCVPGSVTSQTYPLLSRLLAGSNVRQNVIIGTWNGDDYSLSGKSCLMLRVDYGIFPTDCDKSNTVLCEEQT